MNRDKQDILTRIRANKPAAISLPVLPHQEQAHGLLETFIGLVELGGGKALIQQEEKIEELLTSHLSPSTPPSIVSMLSEVAGTVDPTACQAHELQHIDWAVLPAQLAVAENGALYLDESVLPHRVLPFIVQHLVLVVHKSKVVANMHEAYAKIDVSKTGFGVFIAGPSKTADIEQSLVIGAQGARSLTVVIQA